MKSIYNTREILLASEKKIDSFQLNTKQSDELKKLLLEIYDDIFEFCKKNKLSLMLGGGSVLGAVRHGGFIPWDDDMDLMLYREDYDKFVNEFEKAMGDKYEIFVPDGKHKISHLFMKVSRKGTLQEDIYTAGSEVVTGISIDVFPIEDAPENVIAQRIKGYLTNILGYTVISAFMFQQRNEHMRKAYSGTRKAGLNYRLRLILGALFSWRKYEKWYIVYDKFVQGKKNSTMCTIPTGRNHYYGEIQKKEVFFPLKKIEFEGHEAYVPGKTDVYLTKLYGEYMDMPPEDKREKHFYTKIKF